MRRHNWERIAPPGLLGTAGLLMRFGTSGILNGFVYAGVFAVATYLMSCSPLVSSCVAYIAGLLVAFVLHRTFTFVTEGNVYGQLLRYLLAQAMTMAAISGASQVGADVLAWPTWLVILSGIVLAPALNFCLMYFWVFTTAPYGSKV